MRGIKISWLVGIIALAVVGVSFLQVKWLSNALELRQQVFDQTVEPIHQYDFTLDHV